MDEWNEGTVYVLNSSNNGGTVFQSTKISIPSANGNHKTHPLHDFNYNPKIAVSGADVTAIWSGLDGDDILNVFLRHSNNHGLTWDEVIHLTKNEIPEGETPQYGQESVIAKENYVYAMALTTNAYLYIKSSQNSGSSFSNFTRLTAPQGTPHIEGGWWPQSIIDPTDPTGQTAHFIWSYPCTLSTHNGGETYSPAVPVGTQFFWRPDTKRPRICDLSEYH